MGTITSRKRNDGSSGHTAQIRLKKDGRVTYTESKTFDRKAAAQAWLKKRETELAENGVEAKIVDPTLAEVIDTYNEDKEKKKPNGKTKTQVLRSIQNSDLGKLRCSEITSQELMKFAKSINAQPQTVGNYMSHLGSIFRVAKPAWGYPLDMEAMDSIRIVLKKQGHISKSKERNRRPSLQELEKLLTHYTLAERKRSDSIPMTRVILFAIFSTRRQEEITRLAIKDIDRTNREMIVRDMKNPGEKIGNDVRTTLTPEALQLIDLQRKTTARIWPYNAESISASFTRACVLLGIEDLHFHDLRHEGISRLFELGWQIPTVANVSGHRSWTSLKRYTHIRQVGDKYAGWAWMGKILGPTSGSACAPASVLS
jgi:integrase